MWRRSSKRAHCAGVTRESFNLVRGRSHLVVRGHSSNSGARPAVMMAAAWNGRRVEQRSVKQQNATTPFASAYKCRERRRHLRKRFSSSFITDATDVGRVFGTNSLDSSFHSPLSADAHSLRLSIAKARHRPRAGRRHTPTRGAAASLASLSGPPTQPRPRDTHLPAYAGHTRPSLKALRARDAYSQSSWRLRTERARSQYCTGRGAPKRHLAQRSSARRAPTHPWMCAGRAPADPSASPLQRRRRRRRRQWL